nr:hypothetical protein [uncultured Kingella sp.]
MRLFCFSGCLIGMMGSLKAYWRGLIMDWQRQPETGEILVSDCLATKPSHNIFAHTKRQPEN